MKSTYWIVLLLLASILLTTIGCKEEEQIIQEEPTPKNCLLTQIKVPSQNRTTKYIYDQSQRLIADSLSLSAAIRTYEYNGQNQVVAIKLFDFSNQLFSAYTYEYDGNNLKVERSIMYNSGVYMGISRSRLFEYQGTVLTAIENYNHTSDSVKKLESKQLLRYDADNKLKEMEKFILNVNNQLMPYQLVKHTYDQTRMDKTLNWYLMQDIALGFITHLPIKTELLFYNTGSKQYQNSGSPVLRSIGLNKQNNPTLSSSNGTLPLSELTYQCAD